MYEPTDKEIQAAAAEVRGDGWQPIESASRIEDDTEILLSDGNHIVVAIYWECYSNWVDPYEFCPCFDKPTHWMPLPQPPKGEMT